MAKRPSKSGPTTLKGKAETKPRLTAKRATGRAHVPEPPSVEEAMARVNAKPGFFASLTPEQRVALASYDGPEVSGGPGPLVIPRVRRAAS